MLEKTNEYFNKIDEERQDAVVKLYTVVKENLPNGFQESFSYTMPGFVVPLSTYPNGYLNRKDEPLPFISVAAQKNHIALYHMGVVASESLRSWFVSEYTKVSAKKLDMGKSCIRFKKATDIPYDLIAELCSKMNVDEWINLYETARK